MLELTSLKKRLIIYTTILSLFVFYIYIGITHYSLNADISRDLSFMSDLWIHKFVWLGPQLRVGFPSSPLYFYLQLPVLLITNGSAYSPVITQALIGLSGLYLYFNFEKKNKYLSILSVLFIGLSGWWLNSIVHPWNGYMYVHWLLLSLVFLWYKKNLFLSTLFYGISISIHPASLIVSPIFLYEWWNYKNYNLIKKIFIVPSAIFLPWLPIIVFEVITKGFLTRQWLQNKDAGMFLQSGFENIFASISHLQISRWLFFVLVLFSFYSGNKRVRDWYLLLVPTFIFLFFVSPLHTYYLLPIVAVISFLFAQSFIKNKLGQMILILLVLTSLIKIPSQYKRLNNWPPNNRLEKITKVIEQLEKEKLINKNDQYALVSVIDDQNSTPQADDYRFIFRTKGFSANNLVNYNQSDNLIVFFENDQKDIANWSDWHTDQFGAKKVIFSGSVNEIGVIVYSRDY